MMCRLPFSCARSAPPCMVCHRPAPALSCQTGLHLLHGWLEECPRTVQMIRSLLWSCQDAKWNGNQTSHERLSSSCPECVPGVRSVSSGLATRHKHVLDSDRPWCALSSLWCFGWRWRGRLQLYDLSLRWCRGSRKYPPTRKPVSSQVVIPDKPSFTYLPISAQVRTLAPQLTRLPPSASICMSVTSTDRVREKGTSQPILVSSPIMLRQPIPSTCLLDSLITSIS